MDDLSRRGFLCSTLAMGAVLLGVPALAQAPVLPAMDHERWMRRALEYGARNPMAPFGAVVVDMAAGRQVAFGVNRTSDNPIWHGEMDALNAVGTREEGFSWKGLALYTTAEPCSMCATALVRTGIPLVVYGSSIPGLVAVGWDQTDLRMEEIVRRSLATHVTLVGGVLEAECDESFREALARRRKG